MRFNLHLSPNRQQVPFDYQHHLTGAFHRWVGPENTVHDDISLYSLGWLSGRGQVATGGLHFTDGATWTVSFHDPSLAKTMLRGLMAEPDVAFGMRVTEVDEVAVPDFGDEARFVAASPVLARVHRPDGGQTHLRYDDPASDEALTRVLRSKMTAAGFAADEIAAAYVGFDRDFSWAKTKLVTIKRTSHRANACPILARGSSSTMRFLWLVGAGALTGSGFGALK